MKQKLKNSMVISVITVCILYIVNQFVNSAAIIKNLLVKGRGKYFDWRFGKVYYTKSGNGEPLLLIHDLSPFSSSYEWSELVKKLSSDYTVYCIDLPGCGRSDKPSVTYTSFFYVQFISDFIDQVIGKAPHIAATGLSSSFIVMAYQNQSQLFKKLIMINPEDTHKLSLVPDKYTKLKKAIIELPIIGTTIYHILTNHENIEYLFTEKYFYNPFLLKQRHVQVYYESAHLDSGRGKFLEASISSHFVNANIGKALASIDNDILIIGGSKQMNMKDIIHNYQCINPTIKAVTIPDTKYLPQLESPDALYSQIKMFL